MPPNSTDAVGAAILGLPAADSAAVPREHTPDSWRVLLASHPDAAKVIMQSCTVGRDWVLSTAPKATLQLNCAAQASPWLWHRRVAAVADALHTRGTLPTTVKLKCDESGSCATQASVLFTGLRGASRGLQALQVHFDYTQLAPDNQPLTGLLQCAAQTFSGLRSLTVNTWKRCVLPAPALLPQLQHLSIDATDIDAVVRGSLTRSIAAFVPQLSSLEYQGADTAQLFQSLTHTLTHLTLGQALTDDSLQALVTHAPALQSLTVQSLSIGSDACQQEWRVTELKTSHRGWRERADPQVLARLPGLAGPGVTRFELSDMPVRFKAVDARGLHQDVVSRLPQWHFTAHKYNIAGCWSKQPAEQVAALQAVLQQLGPVLRAPHTTDVCWADGWQWDMAMADALVSAKACLPHVTFTVDVYTLSDTQIGPVIRMWPAIASVSASSIELQQQHDGLVWPWEELSLGGFDVTDLVNFPRPAPGKTVTLKVVENVEITDAVTQVDEARLLDMLGRVRLGLTGFHGGLIMGQTCVMVRRSKTNPHADTLRAQLRALNAMQLDPTTTHIEPPTDDSGVKVCIIGWDLTPETIDALRLLPDWRATLNLWLADMSLEPRECAKLAQAIPLSYCQWMLEAVTAAQLAAICAAIDVRRAGLGLDRLYLDIEGFDEDEEGPIGEHVYAMRHY